MKKSIKVTFAAYLGPNLVTALASLYVDDFSHVDGVSVKIEG